VFVDGVPIKNMEAKYDISQRSNVRQLLTEKKNNDSD
jgi:hypothetical protein